MMNPEDDFAGLNCRTAKIRRYWSLRGDTLVRHWIRTWLSEMRAAQRDLTLYDADEILEGASIFRRTTYINLLTNV